MLTKKDRIDCNYVEEELTLAEFSKRFLNLDDEDLEIPEAFILDEHIEVLSKNLKTGKDEFRKIKSFVVKEQVDEHYTDGELKGSADHRIIDENNKDVFLKNHYEFKKIKEPMKVVDIEVEGNENYYANGRLNHNTTSGGKAIAFHSSVRIRLKSVGQIKEKKSGIEEVVGVKTRATVIKNRVGPPYRSADFDMYFNRGIDNYSSWIDILKDMNIVKRSNPGWKLIDQNGEEIKFTNSELDEVLTNNDNLKKYLYEMICDHIIMKYKSNPTIGLSTDDLILDGVETIDE